MSIEFVCGTCGTTLRVPDEHAGKRAKCPSCQGINAIPAVSPMPSPQAPVKTPQAPQHTTNPYTASNIAPAGGIAGHSYQSAHRGSLILTLGILALVCNFALVPGIVAWVMGATDLKQIDAGRMDAEGRGMTQAGKILGMIGTILPLVCILLYIALIILFLIIGAAAAAGGGGF